MSDKIYYAVYTTHEKIWIRADACEVSAGCLTFFDYDVDDSGNVDISGKIAIASFSQGYWQYMYEADVETGESINDQIPFWKRHARPDANKEHAPYNKDRKGLPVRAA